MNMDKLEKSTKSLIKVIGAVIKGVRLKKNQSIEQVANNCSFNIEILQKIENGEGGDIVDVEIIDKICTSLDIKKALLLQGFFHHIHIISTDIYR